MKISCVSDLHLEMSDPPKLSGGDVLVMAGDILCARHLNGEKKNSFIRKNNEKFFRGQLRKYDVVFYVFGNHEFYGCDMTDGSAMIKNFVTSCTDNVYVLDNDVMSHEGILFAGTTLWSPCGRDDPLKRLAIADSVNDFRLIDIDGRKLTPSEACAIHENNVGWIETVLELPYDKVVLITHHAPATPSSRGKEFGDFTYDSAFTADLDRLFLEDNNIVMAIHGHTHRNECYRLGGKLVVSNQRGYPGEGIFRDFDCTAGDVVIGSAAVS